MNDHRGRLLLVALEAARANAELPVLAVLRSWLDSWRGIGTVELGMEHSITSFAASAWEPTPWQAVQGAVREAPRKADVDG